MSDGLLFVPTFQDVLTARERIHPVSYTHLTLPTKA